MNKLNCKAMRDIPANELGERSDMGPSEHQHGGTTSALPTTAALAFSTARDLHAYGPSYKTVLGMGSPLVWRLMKQRCKNSFKKRVLKPSFGIS